MKVLSFPEGDHLQTGIQVAAGEVWEKMLEMNDDSPVEDTICVADKDELLGLDGSKRGLDGPLWLCRI